MKKIVFIALLSLAFQVFANMTSEVNDSINHLGKDVLVGIQVSTLSGDTVYAYHPSMQLVPASSLKIFPGEAALLYLGPQYTFSTNLFASSTAVSHGVLPGNVYLEYSGDPTLTIKDLNQLINTLKAKGVRQIQGNFYFDTFAYDQDDIPAGWNEADLNRCFSAPVNAVIIDRNCTASGTVKNPEQYSVTIIRELLRKNNISVAGNVLPGSVGSKAILISSHHSELLYEIVKRMLKKSDDLIAGALFKKLGEAYSHQSGSWQSGEAAVKSILSNQLHVDLSKAVLVDGSGLSHYNQVSPLQFVSVLRAAYYNRATNRYFVSALPVGGMDGTLKYRLKNYFVHGKVFAKTGSLTGVVSLSGYLETKRHGILVFSIILNSAHGSPETYRPWLDKVLTEIAES